jgi:hypothetical protein
MERYPEEPVWFAQSCIRRLIFTSDWFTQVRIVVLEHSPHSQKCSRRSMPVFVDKTN